MENTPVVQYGRVRTFLSYSFALLIPLCGLFMLPGTMFFMPHWNVHLFSAGSVSLLAIGAVCFFPDRLIRICKNLPWYVIVSGVGITLIALIHTFRQREILQTGDTGFLFFYLSIPLFGLVFGKELLKILPFLMSLVWLWDMAFCLVQKFVWHTLVSGLPSNINWNAALCIFSGTCFIWLITEYVKKNILRIPLILAVVLLSLWVEWETGCRAVIAGALFMSVFLGYAFIRRRKYRQRYRCACYTGIILLGFAAVILLNMNAGAFRQRLAGSDRVFYARTTIDMIFDRPVLGHGLSLFESAYLPYRTEQFFYLPYATDRSDHPHNDLLFAAAGMGIAGAFFWLILALSPLFEFYRRQLHAPSFARCLFYLYLILLVHAQLDLVFFHIPLAVIGLLIPGILWHCILPDETKSELALPVLQKNGFLILSGICGIAILLTGLFSAAMNLLSTQLLYQIRCGEQDADKKLLDVYEVPPRVYYQALAKGLEDGLYLKDPERGLALVRKLKKTPVPDYAHINLIAGILYEEQHKYDEAENAYVREIMIYPALLTPMLRLYKIYYATRQMAKLQIMDGMIKELMAKRCILPEMIPYILSDISFDMRPWNIQYVIDNKIDNKNKTDSKESKNETKAGTGH